MRTQEIGRKGIFFFSLIMSFGLDDDFTSTPDPGSTSAPCANLVIDTPASDKYRWSDWFEDLGKDPGGSTPSEREFAQEEHSDMLTERLGELVWRSYSEVVPSATSPEMAVHRMLDAISSRSWSAYKMAFEETAQSRLSSRTASSGVSGTFSHTRIAIQDQDEQTAKLALITVWTPSDVDRTFPPAKSLVFCQEVTLVRAKKRKETGWLAQIKGLYAPIALGGWYFREDQVEKIPYNFSEVFERALSLEPEQTPSDEEGDIGQGSQLAPQAI